MELEQFSEPLQARIRRPKLRGQFTTVDSSETQFGLLAAGNGEGKIYLLVDPATNLVEKAKFLSFGALESILIFDAFCSLSIGRRLQDLSTIAEATLLKELEGQVLDFSGVKLLAQKLWLARPSMVVSEPIADQPGAYRRKAKEDMNEADLAWLPLSAPQKIAKAEALLVKTLKERVHLSDSQAKIYDIQRDLKVILTFNDTVDIPQRPLIVQFVQEAYQSTLHPQIQVEEKAP
jgi:NifU-like protein involved in Fe-S cluster formation